MVFLQPTSANKTYNVAMSFISGKLFIILVNSHLGIYTILPIIGNFAIGEYVTQEAVLDMMLMLEDFYYEQCVVMMRKSSPYTEKVSQLVGRLHQSGLLLAWETQV